MALNPKFLDPERIGIQCRGKQSELDVFQKCYSYKHYTNLFWAQIFLFRMSGDKPLWIINISVAKAGTFLWCIETELSLFKSRYMILISDLDRALSWIEFILLLRRLLWNIQINGQYPNWDVTKDFIIIFLFCIFM